MSAPVDDGDLDAQAAEYVVGTLDDGERTAFTSRLATDTSAQRAVAAWERRLAPLSSTGDHVSPPSELWSRIEQALGRSPPNLRVIEGGAGPAMIGSSLPGILRSRDRWRFSALAMGSIAAALVAFVVVRETGTFAQPESAATYVAAVNQGGNKPALIITVDLKTREVLVRPIAAQAPVGRSLQLWYIGGGHQPRSMGLVTGNAEHLIIPPGADADGAAVFAISVEPPGGSKGSGPSGAVLYSGQLVKQ